MKYTLTLLLVGLTLSSAPASAAKHSENFFCETDCKMEFKFFRTYAHEGSSLAHLMLAIMYYQGKGTEVNSNLGNRHLLKAARAGEPGAEYQLGYFLMHGMYMEQDLERATNWFKRSAKSNKKGANAKIAQIQSWLNSGNIPPSRVHARLKTDSSNQGQSKAKDKVDEVITITSNFSYTQALAAAKDQTCNASCPPAWHVVTAPLIVLSEDG